MGLVSSWHTSLVMDQYFLLANVCCTLTKYMSLFRRFDARLYFTDKGQFIFKPSEDAQSLTPEEEEMEMSCDEERYLDLHRDSAERELEQGNPQLTKPNEVCLLLLGSYCFRNLIF